MKATPFYAVRPYMRALRIFLAVLCFCTLAYVCLTPDEGLGGLLARQDWMGQEPTHSLPLFLYRIKKNAQAAAARLMLWKPAGRRLWPGVWKATAVVGISQPENLLTRPPLEMTVPIMLLAGHAPPAAYSLLKKFNGK